MVITHDIIFAFLSLADICVLCSYQFNKLTRVFISLGIIHYFQHFRKSTESTLGGGGKSSCTLSKMLVLATVPVHETSLANQHFYSTLLGRREGVCKKSTLCTLV